MPLGVGSGPRSSAVQTNTSDIPACLAVDRLVDLGGVLAELSSETWARLDAAVPPTWSKANPVDIVGDADAARYSAALAAITEGRSARTPTPPPLVRMARRLPGNGFNRPSVSVASNSSSRS
jgi:hypothetical protein